ncbi:radical SAM protein, partial [Mesorhizobium japonicum]|uniref:radical SAM protein n=1 Tax=Mesorhizobium japonicum TaxID=2066070 RepID=UPI003B5B59AC
PSSALAGSADRDLGVYVHVPFCRVRCGYCDFNTYTAEEIRGVRQSDYAGQALAELDLALTVLGDAARPVETVFFGGGTPTLLPAAQLGQLLGGVRDRFGLAPGAEVT